MTAASDSGRNDGWNAAAAMLTRAIAVKPAHPVSGQIPPLLQRGRESPVVVGTTVIAQQLLLQGRVQGLGVRPAVARLASRLKLSGFVSNTSDGVVIHLEGTSEAIAAFRARLRSELPALADCRVGHVLSVLPGGYRNFDIRTTSDSGPTAADVPVDLAMCRECARELSDHTDRRFGYAFCSCTDCGPRYSIVGSMPFERHKTSMTAFALCDSCCQEFRDSEDRRFHAQTTACRSCGPEVWIESPSSTERRTGPDAIASAAELIRSGGILGLKGLGGYQLICDAANEAVVRRLREKKLRPSKPLAVMISSCTDISRPMTEAERTAFSSPANPILILEHACIPSIAAGVNPGMRSLGVFLPTTPLHALLMNELRRPLVVTSGNRDSQPLAFEDTEARTIISTLADGGLHHDRIIERPVDDSVVRVIDGRAVTIRAARGIAPLRLPLRTSHSILAVGGQQKVACAVSNTRQVVLGPHIGDMSSLAARQRFVEQTEALQQLYDTEPDIIAHDLHPDYFTTRWAAGQGRRTIGVQHHHAHIVSGMLEHGLMEQDVLGIAFDGTGYGTDGTVWGGEFLLASKTDFRRVASLLPFFLPGGDAAIRQPWRVAVSLLTAAMPDVTPGQIAALLIHRDGYTRPSLVQIHQVQQLIGSGSGTVTSSMGRLFDGVAALLLGIGSSNFEGEPAMRLESQCDESDDASPYRAELETTDTLIRINWLPLVRAIVADIQAGCLASVIAMRFHRSIANAVGIVAEDFPGYAVVLSGGCFQNRVLTELVIDRLRQQYRIVAPPGTIPPNDGGLAAGQIAIAAAQLEAEEQRRTTACA